MAKMIREKLKKNCPRCGLPGSGPYRRYVLNTLKKRYEPYWYFSHKSHGQWKRQANRREHEKNNAIMVVDGGRTSLCYTYIAHGLCVRNNNQLNAYF